MISAMSGGPALPYYCEKLRSETLRRPCERNLAKAKELRQKFPNAMLGALEHCVVCKGEHLVVRVGAVSHLEGKTGPGPELVKAAIAPQEQDNLAKNEMQAPLPSQEEQGMPGVVKFKDEGEAERFLGPGKIPAAAPPRCPKHPKEPQVACSNTSKRAGQFLGACKVCMAERKIGRKGAKAKEKMTPAVARDFGTVPAPPPAAIKPVRQNDPALIEIDVQPAAVLVPTCNNHPDRPAKIDALGRNMRLCVECLSIRGRKCGVANSEKGLTAPPVSIPLNLPEYAELKAWLEDQAKEFERTLGREIMYRLKLAMRGQI